MPERRIAAERRLHLPAGPIGGGWHVSVPVGCHERQRDLHNDADRRARETFYPGNETYATATETVYQAPVQAENQDGAEPQNNAHDNTKNNGQDTTQNHDQGAAQVRKPKIDDIYAACDKLMKAGVTINRPPRDGTMAFVRSPDKHSIELLQKGAAKPPQEPWTSMPNTGRWQARPARTTLRRRSASNVGAGLDQA